VQKDQVVSINMSDGAKPAPVAKADSVPSTEITKPADAAKGDPPGAPAALQPIPPAPVTKPAPPPEKAASEVKPPPTPSTQPPMPAKEAKPGKPNVPAAAEAAKSSNQSTVPVTEPAHNDTVAAVRPAVASPPAAATPAPPPEAALEPIREQVIGNTYTNETYGFQMYKPPAWQVIAGVPALLPGAIAAMGTDDQTTYLLVGQEPTGNSVESLRDATQLRLRDIMNNFRPLGETSIAVSGARAIEIRFRGGVDEHDWSGVAVFVAHGTRLFTIFGMTLADNDLVQIQENVISRAISSLQFTKQ
jgi:hypothetical protein